MFMADEMVFQEGTLTQEEADEFARIEVTCNTVESPLTLTRLKMPNPHNPPETSRGDK